MNVFTRVLKNAYRTAIGIRIGFENDWVTTQIVHGSARVQG
jgi:hypothetical protein